MWGAPQWKGEEQEMLSPGHQCWSTAIPLLPALAVSTRSTQDTGGASQGHTEGSTVGADPSCFHPELGDIAVVAWSAARANCPEVSPISWEGLAVGHTNTIQVPPVHEHSKWKPPWVHLHAHLAHSSITWVALTRRCINVHVPFIAQHRGKRSDQMFQFVCSGWQAAPCKIVQASPNTRNNIILKTEIHLMM